MDSDLGRLEEDGKPTEFFRWKQARTAVSWPRAWRAGVGAPALGTRGLVSSQPLGLAFDSSPQPDLKPQMVLGG